MFCAGNFLKTKRSWRGYFSSGGKAKLLLTRATWNFTMRPTEKIQQHCSRSSANSFSGTRMGSTEEIWTFTLFKYTHYKERTVSWHPCRWTPIIQIHHFPKKLHWGCIYINILLTYNSGVVLSTGIVLLKITYHIHSQHASQYFLLYYYHTAS
jgi:hypothetical protein